MSTFPKLKYPYNWGVDKVQPFVEKYARGTGFLAEILSRSATDVRRGLVLVLCRGNSVRFESLKKLIKTLDRYDPSDFRRFSGKERKLLYKYYLFLAEDEAIDSKIAREALDSTRNEVLPF